MLLAQFILNFSYDNTIQLYILQYNERWTCEALMSTAISITLTNNYIWVLDKSSVVWVSKCTEPGFVWKKLDIKADQISVAPSGNFTESEIST